MRVKVARECGRDLVARGSVLRCRWL